MGIAATGIESPSERGDELRSIGSPPHELTPDLFVENRRAACAKFDEIFNGGASWLEVDTHSRSQMADLVAAHIATLDETLRTEIEGRCVIVTKSDAWDDVVALRDSHILIADFDIDESDTNAMRMLQRAQKQKHGVVFVCAPGGTPHLNRVSIPEHVHGPGLPSPRNHGSNRSG